MYKENLIKMSVKRLRTAGVKVKVRDIESVEMIGTLRKPHALGYVTQYYLVNFKNGNRIRYCWQPTGYSNSNYECIL